jgi:hypothetical protein
MRLSFSLCELHSSCMTTQTNTKASLLTHFCALCGSPSGIVVKSSKVREYSVSVSVSVSVSASPITQQLNLSNIYQPIIFVYLSLPCAYQPRSSARSRTNMKWPTRSPTTQNEFSTLTPQSACLAIVLKTMLRTTPLIEGLLTFGLFFQTLFSAGSVKLGKL